MAAQLHTVKLLLVMACVTDSYWLVVCNDRRVQIQYLKSTRLLVMIFFSLSGLRVFALFCIGLASCVTVTLMTGLMSMSDD